MPFKRLSFFICLLFSGLTFSAQLTGTATLNGQSNHAGIKVKFIAVNSPAITDSTLTNSNGGYSINISGGIYTIVFSFTGYQSVYYNTGATVILTNTSILNPVNLLPGNVINVSGNVSGNWTANNIYVAQNNLTVTLGSNLNIQPGTVVKFNGDYSLTVNGVLTAIGTSNNRIVFTSNNSPGSEGDWGSIIIYSSASTVQHALIEYAKTSLNIQNSSPFIANNEITRFRDFGIVMYGSSSLIKENSIHDFTLAWSQGITSDNGSSTILCNKIYNGARSGIRPSLNDQVKNNIVHHILQPTRGYGIDCGWNVQSLVENNMVYNCNIGIRIGESVSPSPNPDVINNTIYLNVTGVFFDSFYATGILVNNLIAYNLTGVAQTYTTPACTPSLVSHNLFWNNSTAHIDGVQILGLGQIVNVNANGDSIDPYSNLFIDPLFVNGLPPYYTSGSPCINAGDAAYSANIGCDTNKFCLPIPVGINALSEKLKVHLYPNPFSEYLTIENVLTSEIHQISVFDLNGKLHPCQFQNQTQNSVLVSPESIQPGLYIMEIQFYRQEKHYFRIIKE